MDDAEGKRIKRKVPLEEIPAVCRLQDVAEILDVPVSTLRQWRREGTLPFPPLPKLGKHIRFRGK